MAKSKTKNTERDTDDDLLGSDDNYGEAGHNSGDDAEGPVDVGGVTGKRLKSFIERIERLTEEKNGIADDIKDIYTEAKGVGFDAPTIRQIIKLRKMETDLRREKEELLDLYKAALNME